MTDARPIPDWATRLLVQARPRDCAAVSELTARYDVGTVYTTRDPRHVDAVLRTHAEAGASPAILLDADRYSGNHRKPAASGLDVTWLDYQRRAGLPWALTDSGYIGDDDVNGLVTVLSQARAAGAGVIAALPLAESWWTPPRQEVLIDQVVAANVPVAFMLEHSDDPFGVIKTVRGVAAVLQAVDQPTLVLRCDVSAVGALAFGAAAAAVGTSTGLRHIFPTTERSFGRPAQQSLLWRPGLAHRSHDKLTDAITADPDAEVWVCPCPECYGRSIAWILDDPDPHTASFRHDVAVLRQLADTINDPDLTSVQRQIAWVEACRHAQSRCFEVASSSGRSWEPPKSLNAWNRAALVPTSA